MIAREGWVLIGIALLFTFGTIWIATKWDSRLVFTISLLAGALTLLTIFFFRDPARSAVAEPNMLLSPADGKIVAIDTLDSYPGLTGEVLKVSIFLSVFDVHVNRVPATGKINRVRYVPGEFMAAFEGKASEKNEHTEILMTTPAGQKIIFKQIAGLIARRIVCYLTEDQAVIAGERFGIIRFGSRADLLIPTDSRLLIKMGDRVRAGETVMGYLSGKIVQEGIGSSTGADNAPL